MEGAGWAHGFEGGLGFVGFFAGGWVLRDVFGRWFGVGLDLDDLVDEAGLGFELGRGGAGGLGEKGQEFMGGGVAGEPAVAMEVAQVVDDGRALEQAGGVG